MKKAINLPMEFGLSCEFFVAVFTDAARYVPTFLLDYYKSKIQSYA